MIYWLYWLYFYYSTAVNRIGGVMVSILASRAVDRGFEHQLNKAKHYKIGFVASPLCLQHCGGKAPTGWHGIGIMCTSIVESHVYHRWHLQLITL
jgi:hypothetical protein